MTATVAVTALEETPQKTRRNIRHAVRRAGAHLALIIASVIFGYPLLWTIVASFKPESQIFTLGLWTDKPTLQNYRAAANAIPLVRELLNSVIIAGSQAIGALIFCSAAGFAFAKLEFPGKRALFGLLLATVMVPSFVTILPSFIIMSKLGWVDTYQAARIDGGNNFTVYRRVALPVCWPAMGVLGILTFIAAWNNYLWPLVMLRSTSMQPIALGITSLTTSSLGATPWGAIMAGASVAIVPLLVVFFFFQRKIISGVMRGAIR
jgi:multiple sugar transport system permease protein